jgi:hypothetical protein
MFFEIEKIIQKFKLDGWQVCDDIVKKSLVLKKQSTEIYFFYTGVGKKNAIKNLRYFFKKYNELVDVNNFDKIFILGFAGALKEDLKVGDILEPNIFLCEQFLDEKIVFDTNNLKDISLITTTESLDFEAKKNYKNFDIVDMETFFVLKEILNENTKNTKNIKNTKIFKVVSDELNFEFPKNMNFEIFNILFVEKSLIKQLEFFFKIKLAFFSKLKILKMYFNFLKARKKLSDFFYNHIKNEVKNNV